MLPAADHAFSVRGQLTPNLGKFPYLSPLALVSGAARNGLALFGLAAVLLDQFHDTAVPAASQDKTFLHLAYAKIDNIGFQNQIWLHDGQAAELPTPAG